MTFESLKITISQSLEKISYQETTEEEKLINKIITGVILYHHISSLIDNNTRLYSDSIKETSDNYAKTFYNLVTELKKKYISYKELTRVIKNYKIQNFLQLTETQINNLYNIYCNKQERREFNKNTYS